jgi:hypothetical protein
VVAIINRVVAGLEGCLGLPVTSTLVDPGDRLGGMKIVVILLRIDIQGRKNESWEMTVPLTHERLV